jgi:hypothetical protein
VLLSGSELLCIFYPQATGQDSPRANANKGSIYSVAVSIVNSLCRNPSHAQEKYSKGFARCASGHVSLTTNMIVASPGSVSF